MVDSARDSTCCVDIPKVCFVLFGALAKRIGCFYFHVFVRGFRILTFSSFFLFLNWTYWRLSLSAAIDSSPSCRILSNKRIVSRRGNYSFSVVLKRIWILLLIIFVRSTNTLISLPSKELGGWFIFCLHQFFKATSKGSHLIVFFIIHADRINWHICSTIDHWGLRSWHRSVRSRRFASLIFTLHY